VWFYTETLILKVSVTKIAQIYSRQGAATKMFRNGRANDAMSPFSAKIEFGGMILIFNDFGLKLLIFKGCW
jgi:hypothetical protein